MDFNCSDFFPCSLQPRFGFQWSHATNKQQKKSTCFPQRLCHFALCISNLPPSQNMIIHRSFGEGRDGGGYGPLPGPLSSQGPLPEDGLRRAMCRLSGERGVWGSGRGGGEQGLIGRGARERVGGGRSPGTAICRSLWWITAVCVCEERREIFCSFAVPYPLSSGRRLSKSSEAGARYARKRRSNSSKKRKRRVCAESEGDAFFFWESTSLSARVSRIMPGRGGYSVGRLVEACIRILLLCEAATACPALCTCSGTTVDCHGLGLKTMPRNIPRNAERLWVDTLPPSACACVGVYVWGGGLHHYQKELNENNSWMRHCRPGQVQLDVIGTNASVCWHMLLEEGNFPYHSFSSWELSLLLSLFRPSTFK